MATVRKTVTIKANPQSHHSRRSTWRTTIELLFKFGWSAFWDESFIGLRQRSFPYKFEVTNFATYRDPVSLRFNRSWFLMSDSRRSRQIPIESAAYFAEQGFLGEGLF